MGMSNAPALGRFPTENRLADARSCEGLKGLLSLTEFGPFLVREW